MLVLALGCLLLGLYTGTQAIDAGRVKRANQLGAQGNYTGALREASQVTGGAQLTGALLTEAAADVALTRYAAASSLYARASLRDPSNWSIHFAWSNVLARLGRTAESDVQMQQALVLDPRLGDGGAP